MPETNERALIREVAEWVQAAIEHAADLLAERRHGESAPDALIAIRHEVAEWVEAEMERLATPASDGTTRWYCEYGCGCVLDSRSARYHDCRTPRSEGGGMYADLPSIDRVAHQLADIAFWELEREDYPSVRRELVQRFSAALAALRSEAQGEDAALWHLVTVADRYLWGQADRDALHEAVERVRHAAVAARRGEGGGE